MNNRKVMFERIDDIGIVSFHEPEKLNALTAALKNDLLHVLEQLEQQSSLKAVIFTGRGKSFCAGGDLEAMQQPYDAQAIQQSMDVSTNMIEKIRSLNMVTISAVNGFAAGAGFSIALACDVVIATPSTKFVLAFKNVGLVPDLGLHAHLLRIAPMQKVKQWIFEGKVFSAEEAVAAQFVHTIVEGDVVEAAIAYADELLRGPIEAYLQSKKILHELDDAQFIRSMQRESFAQVYLRAGDEHEQCLHRFLMNKVTKL